MLNGRILFSVRTPMAVVVHLLHLVDLLKHRYNLLYLAHAVRNVLPPYLLKSALPPRHGVAAFNVMRDNKMLCGRNASTAPSAPPMSSVPDRASSWAGCFTSSRTTKLPEIGAPVDELGSAPWHRTP